MFSGVGFIKKTKQKIHARENVRKKNRKERKGRLKGKGGGGKPKKNSCKGKCREKKFMQGKMSEKKIHAQDRLHFDMKP